MSTPAPTYEYQSLNEVFNVVLFYAFLIAIFIAACISVVWIYFSVKKRKANGEVVCDFWGCCLGPGHGHCKAEEVEDDDIDIKSSEDLEMEQTRDFTMEFQQQEEKDHGSESDEKKLEEEVPLDEKKLEQSANVIQKDDEEETTRDSNKEFKQDNAAGATQDASVQMVPVNTNAAEKSQSKRGSDAEDTEKSQSKRGSDVEDTEKSHSKRGSDQEDTCDVINGDM